MNEKIIIVGGGSGIKLIINTLKKIDKYDILGYTNETDEGVILGIPYFGDNEVLKSLIKDLPYCKAVIGIINYELSDERQEIYSLLKNLGFELPVIISKEAIINEDVVLGEGTVILENAMINVCSNLGKCVVINTCAVVEHDCVVNDFVHLSTGSIIGGGVFVDKGTIIGVGAKVIQEKKIGKNCLISAGSIVINDAVIEGTYLGIPARKI